MSAAVKGKPLDEVESLIKTFKSMMSVHQAALGGDEPDDLDAGAMVGADGTLDGAEVLSGEPEAVDPRKLGELAALQGVVKFPVRIKCATLSWNSLTQALQEVAAEA
jgi:nitrogen fixation NifU-like protein